MAEQSLQPSVAKTDMTMAAPSPRNFPAMEPFDARPIREQLTAIIKYGQQSLSRAVDYIQHGFRDPVTEIDEIDIPRIKHAQPEAIWRDPVAKNYVYRNMINWVNHVEMDQLAHWDSASIPHLNKGRRAALNEAVDAEGGILVVDNTERSLNQRLGSPIDRLFHALVHGMYPRGKVYADWYKTPVEGALKIPTGSFEIVQLGFGKQVPEGVISGMRGPKGQTIATTTEKDYGQQNSGWLGNPFVANDVKGGKLTRSEAVKKFKEVFLKKMTTMVDFCMKGSSIKCKRILATLFIC
jgi:hypothetical protein